MKYLLDVNALIAAVWKNHTKHAIADNWIKGRALISCPFSELGFLRVSTHPKAIGATMADARKLLQDFLTRHAVEFVPADLPALQSKPARSGEVTDRYLSDLAARKNCKLATLDTGITHPTVEIIT
jgi:toxin-antitoxin system PIN domain toxin